MISLDQIAANSGGHSIFAPSGSGMWANCAGSLIPNLQAPDSGNIHTATGTVAHEVAAEWLETGIKPEHRVGTTMTISEHGNEWVIPITWTMLDHVEKYVTWCWQVGGTQYVETRVDFSDLTPIDKQGGTADHAACEPGLLTISDLKYGLGVKVFAKRNTQLMIYAYGFFRKYDHLYDFQRIVIRIGQPRLDHFDEWELSRAELLAFTNWVKERCEAAWCIDADRTPGAKQCVFCKVRSSCAARAVFEDQLRNFAFNTDHHIDQTDVNEMLAKLDAREYELTMPAIAELTFEQRCVLLKFKSQSERWWKELETSVFSDLFEGKVSKDWKLVEGRARRKVTDEGQAVEDLQFYGLSEDEIYKKSLRGFGDIEDAIRDLGYRRKDIPAMLAGFTTREAGQPTMAPIDDPKPSISISVDGVFDDHDTDMDDDEL